MGRGRGSGREQHTFRRSPCDSALEKVIRGYKESANLRQSTRIKIYKNSFAPIRVINGLYYRPLAGFDTSDKEHRSTQPAGWSSRLRSLQPYRDQPASLVSIRAMGRPPIAQRVVFTHLNQHFRPLSCSTRLESPSRARPGCMAPRLTTPAARRYPSSWVGTPPNPAPPRRGRFYSPGPPLRLRTRR